MTAEEYSTAVNRILVRGSEAKQKIAAITPDANVAELHDNVLSELDQRIRNAVDSVTLEFLSHDNSEEDADSSEESN